MRWIRKRTTNKTVPIDILSELLSTTHLNERRFSHSLVRHKREGEKKTFIFAERSVYVGTGGNQQ